MNSLYLVGAVVYALFAGWHISTFDNLEDHPEVMCHLFGVVCWPVALPVGVGYVFGKHLKRRRKFLELAEKNRALELKEAQKAATLLSQGKDPF